MQVAEDSLNIWKPIILLGWKSTWCSSSKCQELCTKQHSITTQDSQFLF